MRKILSIAYNEYRMLLTRAATWGIFLTVCIMAQLETYPNAANLARLEFLGQPTYFVCRIIELDALLLVFGLLFPLSGRFPADRKNGMHSLFQSLPLGKGQYLWGKLLGSWGYVLTMLCAFLAINLALYSLATPAAVNAADCLLLYGKALCVSLLPVSFFIGFGSVSLADLMDIRLFYLLAALFFLGNITVVNSAKPMPFYLVTSGDLLRLIWVHPRWPEVSMGSVMANLLFLTGGGFVFAGLLGMGHRPWRSE